VIWLWVIAVLGGAGIDFGCFLLKEYLWRRYAAEQRRLEAVWSVRKD